MLHSGFRIGRIFGIEVRIDWSWLLIFALITWELGTVFTLAHTDWSALLSWGLAGGTAILFFVSVLAHEMAHSLVARARGIPVKNITLFLFGGVSDIQKEPSSAGVEFVMAFVGPLTSLVIGGALYGIAVLTAGPTQDVLTNPIGVISRLGPGDTIILWLGTINLALGVFNLIPGFPLDGGRVLRSILWAASGNLRGATRWASYTGQAIAWAMILTGIGMVFGLTIPFFGTGLISGLWLAFIGWFLNTASVQSYRQLVIHDVLRGVEVRRMMRTDPPTAPITSSVESLVHDHVMSSDDHAFPIMDDGNMAGIISLEDIRKVSRDNWGTTSVSQIMTPAQDIVSVSPDEDAADALDKLMQRDVGQLPVIENGKLVGLLRRQDLIRYLQAHAETWSGRRRR